nr:hypothetical protein [Tanacetum cinerariifolium]
VNQSNMRLLERIVYVSNVSSAGSITTPQMVLNSPLKKVNDVVRLQALIDRKKVIITEATVREALHLDDAESIDCLPNEEIFTELARMRKVESLEQDKVVQALEIIKLKQRVRKLERKNKGEIIAIIDADEDVTLKDVADVAKEVEVEKEVKVEENTDVQGRQAESQAQIYKIDLEH